MSRARLSLVTATFAILAPLAVGCGADPTTLLPDDSPMPGTGGSSASGGSGAGPSATGGTTGGSVGGSGAVGGSTGGTGTGGTSLATGGTATGTGGTAMATGGSFGMSGAGGSSGFAGSAALGGRGGAAGAGGTFGASGSGGFGAGRGGGFGFGGASAGAGGRGLGGRGGASGASAGGSAGSGATVPFSAVAAIFQTQCASSSCHGGRQRPSLTSSNLTTLYNTLMTTTVRQCGSDHLATPNDPNNSAIMELVNWQCGNFVMPEGCQSNPCFNSNDMSTLSAWINEGAPGP